MDRSRLHVRPRSALKHINGIHERNIRLRIPECPLSIRCQTNTREPILVPHPIILHPLEHQRPVCVQGLFGI